MSLLGAGSSIAGRYVLTRQLGRGGMGTVWQADHVALHAPIAIKLLDPELAQTSEARARFMREARALAALRSPHVVQILDYGVEPSHGVPFIAMELLQGETLGQRLDRLNRLSPSETARLLTHVARAVGKAHEQGIVHRDLTPHNIYIVQNDDKEIAKVLDFGIAKVLADAAPPSTQSGVIVGTPHYMSPEQAEGSDTLDHRSDLWALAIIAFECLTGHHPFEGYALGKLMVAICSRPIPAPSSFAPVPAEFDRWFERGTARNPADRFQNARDAASELRRVCGVSADDSRSSLPDTLLTPHGAGSPSMQPLVRSEHPPPSAPRQDSARTRGRTRRVTLAAASLGVTAALGTTLWRLFEARGASVQPLPRVTATVAARLPRLERPRAARVSSARAAAPQASATSAADASYETLLISDLALRMDVPRALATRRSAHRFSSHDGRAVLTFFELEGAASLEQLFTSATAHSTRTVTYQRQGETWFVVSGYDGEKIYYRKVLQHAERLLGFELTFPRSQRDDYAAAVERMEDTFRVAESRAANDGSQRERDVVNQRAR